ncbi:hypothetical protein OROMI_023821 [Orobanche minor]
MAASGTSPYSIGRESTVWGVSLMIGYLGGVNGSHPTTGGRSSPISYS